MTVWGPPQRAHSLLRLLTEHGIDPVEFAEAVDLGIGTVLNAAVTADSWDHYLARWEAARSA